MKNKKLIIKTFTCSLLIFLAFGCESPKERIKLVLDNFDQAIKDHDSYMEQLEKSNPGGASFQESLIAKRKLCERLNMIDTSQTPSDFQIAFKKLISTGCDDLSGHSALVQDEEEAKKYKNAMKEVEEISEKYGYNYNHSSSTK